MFTTQSGTYDSCEESEECSVMEFCKNKSLNLKLKRKKPNQTFLIEKNTQNIRKKCQSVGDLHAVKRSTGCVKSLSESHSLCYCCVPFINAISSNSSSARPHWAKSSVIFRECRLWAMSFHQVIRSHFLQAPMFLPRTRQLLRDSVSEWKVTETCRQIACLSTKTPWTKWINFKCKKL